MNFRQFIENANNRTINASGGAGINPASPGKPATKGGAFGGGGGSPTGTAIDGSPEKAIAGGLGAGFDADHKRVLKQFNTRPPSPFQALYPDPRPAPPPSPMLPGVLPNKKNADPTKVKNVEPPKQPGV